MFLTRGSSRFDSGWPLDALAAPLGFATGQALCEIEDANIPQEELVAFCLTIMDAFGGSLINDSANRLLTTSYT